jgi:CubicO group peptidase (beta-lactamase class C family)
VVDAVLAFDVDPEFSGTVAVRRADAAPTVRCYGYASRTWNLPMREDIRFDLASITKLFTAVAALQLIEAGAFGLHDSVDAYLQRDDLRLASEITPYHLLTHTSGIADDADEEAGEHYEDLFVDRPNYRVRNTADTIPFFAGKPPNFAPGTGCRYCNVGFVVLGLMIEQATGRAYRDYVREHVFARANMERAGYFSMDVVEPDVAEPVEAIRAADGTITGWQRNIYSYPPVGGPDGGAHASVHDLLQFHAALVGGELLGPEFTAEMLRPHEIHSVNEGPDRAVVHAGGTHHYGYAFEFETDRAGRLVSYWKEGVNVGTSGILRHYPSENVTVVVLAVGADAAWDVVRAVDVRIRNDSAG